VASSGALAERQRLEAMRLEGRLVACSAQAEQSRLHAHSLQAAHSYADGARLRAAEDAERHRLKLELEEVRAEVEELPLPLIPSLNPTPNSNQVRAEVEERHWARTELIIAEEADLADLLSARAAAEAAAPTAYTYGYALAPAASAASAASVISADEMESELEQARVQLVAARRQSELARVSLGARLTRLPHTSLTPPSHLHRGLGQGSTG
jgi:hypothetical protein